MMILLASITIHVRIRMSMQDEVGVFLLQQLRWPHAVMCNFQHFHKPVALPSSSHFMLEANIG